MAEATSPNPGTAEDTPLSFDDGVNALSNLDLDPETPDLPEDQETAEADGEGNEPETDDAEATAEDDESDAPEEVAAGGKFVSKDAKVRLDDGTVISVGDLARNNLFQRDYSRKTEELKAERDEFHATKEKVGEVALQIAAQRDFLLQVMPKYGPQPPDRAMMETDPIGYMQAKEAFEEASRDYGQMHAAQQAEQQRAAAEQAENVHKYKAEQQKLLFDTIPEFKKPEVYRQFWTDANDIMVKHYGYTPEELAGAADHRYYRVMRDIVRLHKATTKAPQVTAQMQQKPALLRGGKRNDQGQNISREAQSRKETLRKTGTFEAGVAALLNFKNL
jgi:hypothetical protein